MHKDSFQKKFSLVEIESFLKAAELKNFRAASEKLNISPPAFTTRIKNLEDALGVKLFERNTRNIELTVIGREFHKNISEWISEIDVILTKTSELNPYKKSIIKIACIPSVAYYFLPSFIKKFHEENPNVHVQIHDASANNVLIAVSQGDVDFGINFIGSQESNLEFQALISDKFVLACRKDSPYAQLKKISWKELNKASLIGVSKKSGNRVLLDIELANNGITVELHFEAKHVTTAIGMVEAGVGVAAVPSLAMPSIEHPILSKIPLYEPEITRQIGLIKKKGEKLNYFAEKFYETLIMASQNKKAQDIKLS